MTELVSSYDIYVLKVDGEIIPCITSLPLKDLLKIINERGVEYLSRYRTKFSRLRIRVRGL